MNGRNGRHRIALAAAACSATAALTLAFSGCGWMDDQHIENDATITETVHAVHIDNGAGQVTVRKGEASGGIVIRRDIDYRGDVPPTPGQTVVDGTLLLTSGCGDCGIAYDVTVPESTAVTVINRSGQVTVDGLAGPVDIKASSGEVAGSALRSSSVSVEASSGAIDLRFAAAPAEVTARTHSGAVTVTVPDGPYAIDARTDGGRRTVGDVESPTSPRRLTISSDAGAVTVQPA